MLVKRFNNAFGIVQLRIETGINISFTTARVG